ncbi:MAG: hypothetical protein HQ568_07395 [Calditrichaeota bacterium]|nr:hypothetical protein [Calditrichota bacterium]
MIDEAVQKAYSVLFIRSVLRPSDVWSFRRVGKLGIPLATKNLNTIYTQLVKHKLPEFMLVQDKSSEPLDLSQLPDMATNETLSNFNTILDGASIIFMHATIDAIILECLRICSLIDPNGWKDRLSKRQANLGDIESSSYEDILKIHIARDLEKLERESLLVKIDLLMSLCKPQNGYAPIEQYKYDRNRIENIDSLRHSYVHDESFPVVNIGIEKDLKYLEKTGLYFCVLLNGAYGIQMDPKYIL